MIPTEAIVTIKLALARQQKNYVEGWMDTVHLYQEAKTPDSRQYYGGLMSFWSDQLATLIAAREWLITCTALPYDKKVAAK